MAANVKQLMTPNPVLVQAGTDLVECARLMKRHAIGAVGVMRDERLVGVLTDRDIVLRAIARGRDPQSTTAGDIATTGVVTLAPEAELEEADRKMRVNAVRRLFIVRDDGQPIGVLSANDLDALRDPDSIAGHQMSEWHLGHSDQGLGD